MYTDRSTSLQKKQDDLLEWMTTLSRVFPHTTLLEQHAQLTTTLPKHTHTQSELAYKNNKTELTGVDDDGVEKSLAAHHTDDVLGQRAQLLPQQGTHLVRIVRKTLLHQHLNTQGHRFKPQATCLGTALQATQ